MREFFYDLHIHSCLSPCGDNDMTPANIAGMAALKGLSLVALTDHNSCANCGAFLRACDALGVVGVPGMELTTAEEVHLLCLFPTLSAAERFDSEVQKRRVQIPNRPAIFGDQIRMDENDVEQGREEFLLINATELTLREGAELCRVCGGVPVPAHVDKDANSVVAMLGAIPPDCGFRTAEYREPAAPDVPGGEGLFRISDSDAHYLWDIREAEVSIALGAEEETPEALRRALLARLESGT